MDKLPLIHFLLLWIDDHPCMALRLCIISQLCYSQVRNICPRISLHDLPCHRPMKISFRHQVSPWLSFLLFFNSSRRNPWFEHTSVIIQDILADLTLSLSATQTNMVKEWCRFFQINVFHEYLQHWVYVLFLSSQFYFVRIHRQE